MSPRPGSLADRLASTTNVLVVEDEPDIAGLLGAYFRASGLGLVHVNPRGVDEVMTAIATHGPGCVLLDLNLTGFSGLDVLEAIRADAASADLPVLIVSADSRPATRQRAEQLGMTGFVAKPFSVSDLFDQAAELARGGPAAPPPADRSLEEALERHLMRGKQRSEPVSFALVTTGGRNDMALQVLRNDLPDAVLGPGELGEIAVILPGVDAGATATVLAQALAACGAGARAGVADAPAHASTADQLYMAADTALAEAVEGNQPVVAAR